MSLLPESLTEILPQADTVVLALVSGVTLESHGEIAPDVLTHPQTVELVVVKVMRGNTLVQVGQKLLAETPVGADALRLGHKGIFLLKQNERGGAPIILGRFGPDSWPLSRVEEALSLPT